MTDISTANALPLLPLNSGVVLPGMVVTITVETADGAAAADAIARGAQQLVLVPRLPASDGSPDPTGNPDPSAGSGTDAGASAINEGSETERSRSSANETATDETAGDETAGDETAGDETAGDETAGDETAGDETATNKTATNKTATNKTAGDEAAGDETAESGSRLAGTRYARVGVVAAVESAGELPGGIRALMVRGLHRVHIGTGVPGEGDVTWVQVERIDTHPSTERARQLAGAYRSVAEELMRIRGAIRGPDLLRGLIDPGQIADTAAYDPDLPMERKVEILETLDVEERLTKVLAWAREALAEAKVTERIKDEVEENLERTQREFLLRQQLAAIRKELGEGEDEDGEGGCQERFDAMELPTDVRAAVSRELRKLERLGEQNPEHGWVRTWLDTVAELPWGTRSEDRLDLAAARQVLDEDHTGLDEVKERVVEHLAVRKLRAERGLDGEGRPAAGMEDAPSRAGGGAILLLAGPPGVGKTSLGESVARALGRKFARVALGGVRDEAEIRGHRRTYVGARAGRFVRALQEAGTMNPVLLLDEVDKVGADWRGDPSSALLEVLDPAQNHSFRDHYLEVDLDLSDVLFVATANVLDTIPAPLLDRMELIQLDGYTLGEKVAIGRDHLLPRQLGRAGLRAGEVTVTDAALERTAEEYTREAGVRGLERELGKLLRKVATRVAAGEAAPPLTVDTDEVPGYLGRQRVFLEAAERTADPGVATGLAVTGAGGEVLFVEATAMDGEAGLTITGQLGDVMRESATIGLSYVRAHADALGLPADAFERRRFHVHVPAGAVPKDGPSAGVAMVTALASLLTGRTARPEVGMTGEVTLQGRVLPVGGVKQKVLAAHRAGLREVVLPHRNAGDLDDLDEQVRAELTVHLVSDVREALGHTLVPAAAADTPTA